MKFFQKISKIWGKLRIDRFANNENTKTEKFNSKYWCPVIDLISYRDNRCMSGKSKFFETETDLMNYRHDRCMSGECKMFEIETG